MQNVLFVIIYAVFCNTHIMLLCVNHLQITKVHYYDILCVYYWVTYGSKGRMKRADTFEGETGEHAVLCGGEDSRGEEDEDSLRN